jgi:CheY-like chemotaxis protein
MEEPKRPSVPVLIVEDESLIRMGAVYQIEDAGFKVYEAGSADAAARSAQGNLSHLHGWRHAGLDGRA